MPKGSLGASPFVWSALQGCYQLDGLGRHQNPFENAQASSEKWRLCPLGRLACAWPAHPEWAGAGSGCLPMGRVAMVVVAAVARVCVFLPPPPRAPAHIHRCRNNHGHYSYHGDSDSGRDASFLTQTALFHLLCFSKPLSFCMRRQM